MSRSASFGRLSAKKVEVNLRMTRLTKATCKVDFGSKKRVFLTFDIEDIVNMQCSIRSLQNVLHLLESHNLRGLFFVTGNMTEKILLRPEILRLLKLNEIGYHATSHSVRPRIFEFTDVQSYQEAVEESIRRETTHVNPNTGDSQGEGGIVVLRQIFSDRNIESFRAPSFCWTPTHLGALSRLGFRFDFSTEILKIPFFHKGITFYPYPALIIDEMNLKLFILDSIKFVFHFLKEKYTVILVHPHQFMTKQEWDAPHSGSKGFNEVNLKSEEEIKKGFILLELFLGTLSFLKKIKLIDVTPNLERSEVSLRTDEIDIEKIYQTVASRYKKYGGYSPKFLLRHFYLYFGCDDEKT